MAFSKRLQTVVLAHDDDWEGFRRAARRLLCADVEPEDVHWRIADDAQGALDLFDNAEGAPGDALSSSLMNEVSDTPSCLRLPRALLNALPLVILHRSPERLHHLYRFLWRWRHEPALRSDPLDPDVKAINDYYREVRHDACRMLGFVRFRTVSGRRGELNEQIGDEAESIVRIAWYEPRHRIVRLTAPLFAQRFPPHRWVILTPEASASWDTEHLAFHSGVTAAAAPPPDAGETMWLTYYANQFNATRRNPAALRRCMPLDYWKNLPEAGLIASLLAGR